jgi:hypothetical protein
MTPSDLMIWATLMLSYSIWIMKEVGLLGDDRLHHGKVECGPSGRRRSPSTGLLAVAERVRYRKLKTRIPHFGEKRPPEMR